MKKTVLITFLFVLGVASSNAQDSLKFRVGVFFGTNFPTQDFKSTDADNEMAGFAKVGHSYGINLGIRINKNLSLEALLKRQFHQYNTTAFKENLGNQSFYNWSVTADYWRIWGLLVGVSSKMPLNQTGRAYIRAKATAGFLNAISPQINYNATDPYRRTTYNSFSEVAGTGLAYQLGGSFCYRLLQDLEIALSIDYFNATVNFNNIIKETRYINFKRSSFLNTEKTFQTINSRLGFSYLF